MLSRLSTFVVNPLSWWLLAASALGLELCALFFQYGMGLEPCIMCVYQRLAIFGLMFAGLLGALGSKWQLVRLLAFTVWAISAIWGLQIAIEHVDIQTSTNSFFYTCDLIPNFPTWMPIHEWLPSLFEATGDCGVIVWSFLGYSMSQWMIVVYSVYVALFALFFSARIMSLLSKKQ